MIRWNIRRRQASSVVGLLLLIALVGIAFPIEARPRGARIEQHAGTWKTWILASADQVAVPAPPDAKATKAELAELQKLAESRDAAALDEIRYWDTGAPSYRWNQIALDVAEHDDAQISEMRVMSLVHATLYDATVAAWKAKYTYNRPRPSEVDSKLTTVVPNPGTPSYPCEYAVMAGAASSVLSYLSPTRAAAFDEKAQTAVRSRLRAGTSFPSDVAAGLDLGRRVAAIAIERAKRDNTDATWDGKMPTEPGRWKGTNPLLPTMGTWKTWILSSGRELRPPAPTITREMIEEVTKFTPTSEQRRAAIRWGVTSLNAYWNEVATRMIFEYRLDDNLPRVERIYSLLHTALYDADVACFDAKYAYWGTRPNQYDPTFTSLIRTPNMPGYPSGHATKAGAGAAALAHFFPAEAKEFTAAAEECAWSRLWGGVHIKLDNDAGLELGRRIAARGAERFKNESAR